MATTLLDLRTDVRSMIQEPTARMCSDTEINFWINRGIRNFSAMVKWYQRIVAYKVIANQSEYATPADLIDLEMLWWSVSGGADYRLRLLDQSEWAAQKYLRTNQASVVPVYALHVPHDKLVQLHPGPSASGQATTLSANITASSTTISVASTSGFPTAGKILLNAGAVNEEQVRYFNTSSTAFLQCRRGDGDTTAVNHSSGDTVDFGALWMTIRAMPKDLVNDSDTTPLPEDFIEALTHYGSWKAYLKRQEFDKAQLHKAAYAEMRKEAADERFNEDLDGTPGLKDEETGMGFWSDP